jgi:hypothetical protein
MALAWAEALAEAVLVSSFRGPRAEEGETQSRAASRRAASMGWGQRGVMLAGVDCCKNESWHGRGKSMDGENASRVCLGRLQAGSGGSIPAPRAQSSSSLHLFNTQRT